MIFHRRYSQDLERLRVQKVLNCTNSTDYKACSDRLINQIIFIFSS